MLANQTEYQMLQSLRQEMDEINRQLYAIVTCDKVDTQALAKFKPLDKLLKSKESLYRNLLASIMIRPPVVQKL